MLKKIIVLFYCYLTLNAKVTDISSNGNNCYTYSHDTGKIEINCNGNKSEIDNNKIYQFGAKGNLTGKSIFLENQIRFSPNNDFIVIPTFGDPTPRAGIGGTDKDNLYEIIRLNIKTGEIKVIVRRKDNAKITNYFDFTPEQYPGISSGEIIPLNYGVKDDGKVIFYADIIVNLNGMRSIVKNGYFISTERDGEFYQVMTTNNTAFNTPIYPETTSHPTIKGDGFYYTITENGIGKLMFYKGFEKGKEKIEVARTSTPYEGEQVNLSTRIIQNRDKVYWGNTYPSLFPSLYTVTESRKPVFSSRFFNLNISVSDIYIVNDNLIFATTVPFEQKDPWKNNSIYAVINGKPYKVVSSGERVGSTTVGTISRNIHFDGDKVIFISDGNIVSKNVNIINDMKIENDRFVIKGVFPDINQFFRVLIDGVMVVPEGVIPSSVKYDKNEISFLIPANIYGKRKIEILFQTINGTVGAVNNGIEFEFPRVEIELGFVEGGPHLQVGPGEIYKMNIGSNITGIFSMSAENANGNHPVTISNNIPSRNLIIEGKDYINTKYIVIFTASNGEEKRIEFFIEILPPKINFLTSIREDGKFFVGDEMYISGENLSPDGEEHLGGIGGFSVKINGMDCGVNFVSLTFLIIQIPDLEITDEEENWITLTVFGRETAYKVRIEKRIQDNAEVRH